MKEPFYSKRNVYFPRENMSLCDSSRKICRLGGTKNIDVFDQFDPLQIASVSSSCSQLRHDDDVSHRKREREMMMTTTVERSAAAAAFLCAMRNAD